MISIAAGPPPQRRQHGRITRDSETLPDALGAIGLPWRAETLLGRLERNGDITSHERQAGEEFHRAFRLAHLDPLKAADLMRGQPSRPTGPHGIEPARHTIAVALQALGGHGSPCGACAWYVLGCEYSMREWAMREGWSGKPVSERVAKGILLGTLGVLTRHFGT